MDTPNIDYNKLMKFSGLKKEALERNESVEYKDRKFVFEYYEEGGHNLFSLTVTEVDPITDVDIEEVFSESDPSVISEFIEDGILDMNDPIGFIEYLDTSGYIPKSRSYYWWKVWILEVWGNEQDGYDVNDRRQYGDIIISENDPDEKIVQLLVSQGVLRAGVTLNDLRVEGDDSRIDIDEGNTGMPIVSLERERALTNEEMEQHNLESGIEEKDMDEWEERWHKRSGLTKKSYDPEQRPSEEFVAEWFEKAFGRKPSADPSYYRQWLKRFFDSTAYDRMDYERRDVYDSMMGELKTNEVNDWEERWHVRSSIERKSWQAEQSRSPIEESYREYQITMLKFRPDLKSGIIALDIPSRRRDVVDKFVIYNDGTVAFDHWYPYIMHDELSDYIREKRREQLPPMVQNSCVVVASDDLLL